MGNLEELKKKRVAIICPTLSRGGAERIVGVLSKQIIDSVDNLYIFLFDSKEITYDYSGTLVDLRLGNYSTRSKIKIFNRAKTVIKYCKLLWKLRSEKKKYNIDISISFMDTPNILNILSRTKDKIVLSVRINKSVQNRKHNISLSRKIEILLMKLLYKYSNKIIAISEGVRRDLITNFNLKETLVTTIYNFIDIKEIVEKKDETIPNEQEDFFNNHDVIINVGRFELQKNQINLVEEFKIINDEFPNTRLALVGQGTLEDKIRAKIDELNISDKVLIISYTNNPFKYISKAKVFVLNSYYEGFGNVILEAMTCNVPVISTDCKSGPREIITGEFNYKDKMHEVEIYNRGILIPLQDKSEGEKHWLYKAIKILLNDSNLRNNIIKSASHYVMNEHSNEEIKKQWINEISL